MAQVQAFNSERGVHSTNYILVNASVIEASGNGSIASGVAEDDGSIISSGAGSFAHGYGT